MQSRPSHRGDLSQDSLAGSAHPKLVTPRSIDPSARTAKRAYNALSASSVGLEMGVSVIIGLVVGTAMDRWLGTAPWMLFLWLGFGLAAGFRGVLRAVKRADRAAEAEAREDAEARGLS